MPGTAVIIPFFQRESHVLAAAVRSALAQEDAGPVTVVVCDDASPIRAEDELAALDPAERDRVILVRQANQGAGAARNAALDAVPPGTEWIAFLDSDDRWRPRHLARAITALQQGYDLCFADAQRENESRSHFQGADFDPARHEPLDVLPDLYRLTGDFLTLNIRMSPVSISTVVMRASALGELRFMPVPVEDLLFWFEAARRPIRVAFDGTLQVDYGRGNITVTGHWKSPEELRMCLLYHRVFMHVARSFALTAEQRGILQGRMARNRRLFSAVMLGQIADGRLPSWKIVSSFLTLDRRTAGEILATGASKVAKRLKLSRPVSVARD